MPLRHPTRAILVLLQERPMTTEELAERVGGARGLVEAMARAGEVVRGPDGTWDVLRP